MGYFCLPEKQTTEGYLEACVKNIELFLPYINDPNPPIYLLEGFATNNIKDALIKLKENK